MDVLHLTMEAEASAVVTPSGSTPPQTVAEAAALATPQENR